MPDSIATGLDYRMLRETFARHQLFEDKTWQLSPGAFRLTPAQVEELERIGKAAAEFHRAIELLYLKSAAGKNLLRNRAFTAPWVAEYYDRGKPTSIRSWNRGEKLRGVLPPVIRPDLLITEDGFALTEFDSIPGGIGLTGFLNRLYEAVESGVIGGGDRMIEGFYRSVAAARPGKHAPLVAIVVSEEAAVYYPEMLWLAAQARAAGWPVFCLRAGELIPLGGGLYFDLEGNPEKIDIIYRFFELYDLPNIETSDYLVEAWEEDEVKIVPAPRSIFEEKLSLGLFHHHLLQDFWKESLSRDALKTLRRIIPKTWIVDPQPLPPGAVYVGPTVGGRPISDWRQLADASQRERDLILKISGFDETAEGARSVIYGRDSSREEWAAGIELALGRSGTHLHILQEYRKPKRSTHLVYEPDGRAIESQGRVRLCPYYFGSGGDYELSGVLATFCPADKKIIHGMRDAAMLPGRVSS